MRFDPEKARQMAAQGIPSLDPYSHPATALYLALDRISELEEALIEERANSVGSMAAMSGRLMDCIEAEKEARGQLHSEGKI